MILENKVEEKNPSKPKKDNLPFIISLTGGMVASYLSPITSNFSSFAREYGLLTLTGLAALSVAGALSKIPEINKANKEDPITDYKERYKRTTKSLLNGAGSYIKKGAKWYPLASAFGISINLLHPY